MKKLTMVTKTVLKLGTKTINSFTLIGEDYSIVNCGEEELLKQLNSGTIEVTNLGVGAKGVVATNGAMDKYTTIDGATGTIVGKPSPVILNRVEKNGALVGYTVFNIKGVLQEISVQTAVKLHELTPFSNGKLRHTQNGDIISSINGNYPLRLINIDDKKDGKVTIDLVFLGSTIENKSKGLIKYAGTIINCSNAGKLSGIYKTIASENAKLANKLLANGKDVYIPGSLDIKRTATAGFYAVIPFDILIKLIKETGNKVDNNIGKIIVSTVEYKDDTVYESVYELDKKLNVIEKKLDNGETGKSVTNYVVEIVKTLKGVEIK